MLVVISCPKCGHLGRVPQGRIGHKVRCKGCGNTFRPEAALAQPPSEGLAAAAKRGTPTEEPPEPGLIGWLKRPQVIDGAISGALAGILTGLIIGAVTGGINAKVNESDPIPRAGQASSGIFAGVLGGGLFGISKGFVGGAVLGGGLGLLAAYFQGKPLAATRRRALVIGLLTGACVTALIDYSWIALGVVLGALGSSFWSLLQNWERAADTPFVSSFHLEEEEVPPKAAT